MSYLAEPLSASKLFCAASALVRNSSTEVFSVTDTDVAPDDPKSVVCLVLVLSSFRFWRRLNENIV